MFLSEGGGVIITTESGESLHFFEGERTSPACWPLSSPLAAPLVTLGGSANSSEAASPRFIVGEGGGLGSRARGVTRRAYRGVDGGKILAKDGHEFDYRPAEKLDFTP